MNELAEIVVVKICSREVNELQKVYKGPFELPWKFITDSMLMFYGKQAVEFLEIPTDGTDGATTCQLLDLTSNPKGMPAHERYTSVGDTWEELYRRYIIWQEEQPVNPIVCEGKTYTAEQVFEVVRKFLRSHTKKGYLKPKDWIILGVINLAFKPERSLTQRNQ